MTALSAGACQERLPETFSVRYLGRAAARGLWGVKHTRGPVDRLVGLAKRDGAATPAALLTVAPAGCTLHSADGGTARHFPVDSVSYGVQDLVYTRVFSMIVVRGDRDARDADEPFQCHAFVCESRQAARKLTYCLATAFQEYSRSVRGASASASVGPPRALIDLTGSGDPDQADSSEA